MFLTERKLRDVFWGNYNYSGRALRYQFECPIREGNADLITIEKYQGNYQINAFEFKLADIKKALLQAKENAQYANKTWIVVPAEKRDVIENRYMGYLREHQIGAILVEEEGHWEVLYRAYYHTEITLHQQVLKLAMKEY